MLTLCSFLFLASCGQKEPSDQFTPEKFKEMVSDPVFTNYFNALETQARLTTESTTLDLMKFSQIIKSKATTDNACHVDKAIFNGDAEMEQLVDIFCNVGNTSRALNDKFPFFSKMPEDERLAFLMEYDIKFNYDTEAMKKKAAIEVEKIKKD